jgi:hydrogenase nickel incorporation protein HypA/HybF
MHELTLLYGVVDKVGEVVKDNGLDHVDAIVIEVGEATSVIPEFLQDGYEVISDDYDFLRGSELIIERITAVGRCRQCGTEFPIVANKGICPECGSFDKDIIDGMDFFIREVRILEDQQGPDS